MHRIALRLEYNGAAFHGWQSQPDVANVQDALETALTRIAGHPVRTHCAGRTDAGVHALGQVVHFDSAAERPLSAWIRGVNALLPGDVAVLQARAVAPDFHARYSAVARSYRYWLLNRPQRPGVLTGKVGWFHRPLDVAAMRIAAACLCGQHDFSVFRAAQCQARSPVKTIRQFSIRKHGDFLRIDCTADAFLYHMVRNMIGALLVVGQGHKKPEWITELLACRDRRYAPPTFSASGLYFLRVDYAQPLWRS